MPEGRVVGILLHRLIEHFGLASHDRDLLATTAEGAAATRRAAGGIGPAAGRGGRRRAVSGCSRPGPTWPALFQSARVWHEVPVAIRDGDRIVHGAIDSLLVGEGRAWVLEFKTGRPDPSHERQLARYVEAARRLLPGVEVEARLVYARDSARESV